MQSIFLFATAQRCRTCLAQRTMDFSVMSRLDPYGNRKGRRSASCVRLSRFDGSKWSRWVNVKGRPAWEVRRYMLPCPA